MIRLIYASTALKEWSPEELLDLLKECRKNNGAKNITGIPLTDPAVPPDSIP